MFDNLLALMIWVSSVSGLALPPNNKLPDVSYTHIPADPCDKSLVAVGRYLKNHIELDSKQFSGQDKAEQTCEVAHELTHYLQDVNHVDMSYPEPQAYSVQARCLAMYPGHKRQVDWLLNMASKKDPYHHSINCER